MSKNNILRKILMMTIPQPSHHSSSELRVLEKLSTNRNELKAQQGTLIQSMDQKFQVHLQNRRYHN